MQLYIVYNGMYSAAQNSIYGKAGKGVYLTMLFSGNYYSDVDKGDIIWYSGTNSKDD
jgi:hypothetical protein